MNKAKQIPLREGLWTIPSSPGEQLQLIGSKCLNCGEIVFPRKDKGICLNCQQKGLVDTKLSTVGKIHSFTVVMQRPPIYYKGPVPYALAWVELPEGVRFETLLTDGDFESLQVGMSVELVIEKLHEDEEGNEVMTYKFRPVDARKEGDG